MSKATEELSVKYPTGKDFATQFNFDYCLERFIEIKTPCDAIDSGMPSLNELSLVYGELNLSLLLESWLVNLSAFMDFQITALQSRQTALLMLEECYNMNLADLTLLFKRIRKGKYGDFFGKFNGQNILKSCISYKQERWSAKPQGLKF